MTPPSAPSHLSAASKKLYRRLSADYDLGREPHALEVLRLACEAVDRCAQARDVLALNGGPFIADRFGVPKAHPGVGVERDARLAALRAFRELGLDGEEPEPRPPRRGSGALT